MKPTPESGADPDELVTVSTVNEPTLAELIRSELEAEGIPAQVSGENQAGLAGVIGIAILVRAVDAARAREFLERHDRAQNDDDA